MAHSPNQIALSKKSRKGAAADPERAALRQSVRTEDSLKAAKVAASAAQDRKADDVVVVDLRGLSSYTDFLVICSGTSDRMPSSTPARAAEIPLATNIQNRIVFRLRPESNAARGLAPSPT